ncbi:S1 family peptidase [Nonomuraea sediminis]|uniref:S1 family peptidase n=1 Tax=Nonomuraea sediminis TaxID=2835864 RepID=UPI001BDCA676|nr:trypsin-like serine protease [Nonomuraea sediminis]
MRFVPFVAILPALVLGVLGISLPASAITNGSADGNAHPEVGALIGQKAHPDGSWSYCTGTLISPTVFLTAAHCGHKGQKTARVTFVNEYKPGSQLFTGRYIPDPRYKKKSDLHDMAVVVFSAAVPDIKPAQLPAAGMLDQLRTNKKLKATPFTPVGYGALSVTRKGDYRYNDTRNQASISFKAVSRRWLELTPDRAKGDGSTCFGDSGGPNFLGGRDSHLLIATTISGQDDACRRANLDYRLDTPIVRHFLGKFVTLP